MTIFREVSDFLRNWRAGRQPEIALTRARRLLAQNRPSQAASLLGRAAQAGLPEAAHELGLCYIAGAGVPADAAQAAFWLERAARAGVVAARVKLAGLLLYGIASADGLFAVPYEQTPDRFTQAAHWARLAAEAGDPTGMALLAFCLSSGPAALRDEAEAALWYARAAAAGVPQAQLGHGLILLAQAQTPAQAAAALAELEAAALTGLAQAHDCLGTIFESGSGLVPQDLARAMAHYRRAAEGGITHAMGRYGLALLEGRGVKPDPVAGETWARRAALAGDAACALRLGQIYADPSGPLPPNFMEAASWFRLSAEAGNAEAANAMGKLHLLGKGVPKDQTEALAWFARANELR